MTDEWDDPASSDADPILWTVPLVILNAVMLGLGVSAAWDGLYGYSTAMLALVGVFSLAAYAIEAARRGVK